MSRVNEVLAAAKEIAAQRNGEVVVLVLAKGHTSYLSSLPQDAFLILTALRAAQWRLVREVQKDPVADTPPGTEGRP